MQIKDQVCMEKTGTISKTPVIQMLTDEEKELVNLISTIGKSNILKKAHESGNNIHPDFSRQAKQLQHTGSGNANKAVV